MLALSGIGLTPKEYILPKPSFSLGSCEKEMVDQAKSISSSRQQQQRPNSVEAAAAAVAGVGGEEMSLVELRRLGRSLRREYLIRSHETATRRILQKSRSILSGLRATTVAEPRGAAANYHAAKKVQTLPLSCPPSSSSLASSNGLRAARANERNEMAPNHIMGAATEEDLLPCNKVRPALFKAPLNMWDFLRAKAELLQTDDAQRRPQLEDKASFMTSLKNLIKNIHPGDQPPKPPAVQQQLNVSRVYDWSGQVRLYSAGAALTPHNLHAGRWTKGGQRFTSEDNGQSTSAWKRRSLGLLVKVEFMPDVQFLSCPAAETSASDAMVQIDPVCVADDPLSCALSAIPFTYECVDFTQRVLKDLILHFNHASVSSNLLRKATLKPKLNLDDQEHLALTVLVPTVLELLLPEENEASHYAGQSRSAGCRPGPQDEDIRADVTSVGEDRELTWEQCKDVRADLVLFLPQVLETPSIHMQDPLQFLPQTDLIRTLLDLDRLGALSRISFFHHPIFRDRKVVVLVARFLRSKRAPNQIRCRRESKAYLLRVGTIYEPFATTTAEDEEDAEGENL